ncbi:MAG: hypothetical protein HRT44_07195 [Bdellovibrionales bacterium]|nr:hypothetical protein [Bdellovibrionales bacterium]NQZ19022.1 hypothetical protein [Bdellovibrionales bacterium]
MRELKHLHRGLGLVLMWCLTATTFVSPAFAKKAKQSSSYDSSIQRSNFMAIEPRYEKYLDKQIEDRRAQFTWKMRFDAEGFQTEDNRQSQSVGTTFRAKFKYRLLDSLYFNAKANMNLQSGRSQDIFGDLEPESGFFPLETNVSWEPVEEVLTVKAGQIHQRWINEPMFIGNLGFPGAYEKLNINIGNISSIGVIGQQLIPTSSTLSTRVGERETTPTLFTATAYAKLGLTSNNFLNLYGTTYDYNDLPSIVAFWSGVTGNTIDGGQGTDINNARFAYGFRGYMGRAVFEQKFSNSLSAQIQHGVIVNEEAPDTLGQAQNTRLAIANDFGRWILGARFSNFFVESDAVPSFYLGARYGKTNRIGQSYSVFFESKEWGVNFLGQYVQADLLRDRGTINTSLQQDNQQIFYIKVETLYDFI